MLERLAGMLRRGSEEEEEYEPERLPIRRCMPDYHTGLYEEEIIEREEAYTSSLHHILFTTV